MDYTLPARMYVIRSARFWRVAALFFMLPGLSAAQVFEAKVETREVTLGSTFEVSFSLKDARGERFRAPEFPDFKIVGGPNEMRGMTIINGRSSSHHTWSYELEPRRAGTFTIGPASIVSDGKTLTTQSLTVRVVPAKARPNVNLPPGSSDNLFITGELDRTVAWLGQQLTWRIQLYTQLSLEGADMIEMPDFEGFYAKEKRRFDTRVRYQTIRGKKYAVKTLYEEALFPQETGELTIGAAKVRVGIEQPGTFGAFLGPKPVVLQTQPIQLTVKALPAPLPDPFSGGVGQYEWQVETDRDSLSTDDALMLKVSLRGNGDSKRFSAPALVLPPGLEGFEPKIVEEEEYENGEEVVHSKVLEYVILPKQPGEYHIAAVLSFFDPDSNRFQTLKADSLPVLRVTPGKNYRSDSGALDTLPVQPPPAVSKESGIWEKISAWLQSPFSWSLLALPVILFGIFYLLKKRKTSSVPGSARTTAGKPAPASAPAKAARERFANAARLINAGNPRFFYDELFKSLQAYIASRFDLTPTQMTQENLRKVLTEKRVSAGTIQNVLAVWHTCEQALFAGQTQSAQMESTWRLAESAVLDMEKNYRRSSNT
ncbi:MAG: protein BatD [Haliscomenobacteraceae bacterium CHB4]|nr:hypothetical protein [Saprospiraceae bacterium]MCE7924082.1 protein BatD [Haliscomenobacteraceae bacterium CHB4]